MPYFNLAATMAFLDPFRAANYLEGTSLFRGHIISETGGPLSASNGVEVGTTPLADAEMDFAEMLFVSSSWEPEWHVSPALGTHLRNSAKRQAILSGLEPGTFVLARAGLLEEYIATVH